MKKGLLTASTLILLGLVVPFQFLYAITLDATSSSAAQVNSASYSYSHTTGSSSSLFVCVTSYDGTAEASANVTDVSYNGSSLTHLGTASRNTSGTQWIRSEIWGMANPSVGTFSVGVTHGGTADLTRSGALSLTDVDTSNISEDYASSVGIGTPTLTTATSTTDNAWLFDCIYHEDGTSLTPNANQTTIFNGISSGDIEASSYRSNLTTAGGYTMIWTPNASNDFAHSVISIKDFVASTSSTSTFSTSDLIPINVGLASTIFLVAFGFFFYVSSS